MGKYGDLVFRDRSTNLDFVVLVNGKLILKKVIKLDI